MKIIQLLTNFTTGDAISNDVSAIDEILKEEKYDSRIMALKIHEAYSGLASVVDLSGIQPDDVVIFHKSTGDALTGRIAGLSCRKGIVYHNITPAGYLFPYDPVMAYVLYMGRRQLKKNLSRYDFAWGVSEYNCRELISMGMATDRTAVLPILMKHHPVQPDPDALRQLNESKGINLLFIGRISPQKKQEDIIKVYWHVLQKDPEARLFLVGRWNGLEKYYAKLKGFCADLGLTDQQVIFTGGVSEEEKAAYLTGADALVCMSEHEGFCVPLLEAMEYGLPVIAYHAAAIPETLGESGILFRKKDYAAIAGELSRLKEDLPYRQEVITKQRERLHQFDYDVVRNRLLELIRGEIHE